MARQRQCSVGPIPLVLCILDPANSDMNNQHDCQIRRRLRALIYGHERRVQMKNSNILVSEFRKIIFWAFMYAFSKTHYTGNQKSLPLHFTEYQRERSETKGTDLTSLSLPKSSKRHKAWQQLTKVRHKTL